MAIDTRHRDKNGEISRKRGITLRAPILGATALMLSVGVASAQAVYVSPSYGSVARPYVAPPGVYVVPPTLPAVSGYDAADVTTPLYDYAPVPTTKSVTAPQPEPSNSSRK